VKTVYRRFAGLDGIIDIGRGKTEHGPTRMLRIPRELAYGQFMK
jgi:hypothetical protein